IDQAWHAAAPLLAAGDERGAGLLSRQQQLRGWAADTQRRIPGWVSEARTLEKWLGVSLPGGVAGGADQRGGEADPSPAVLRCLLRLANLCQTDTAPERAWVLDPRKLEEARALITSARPAFAEQLRRKADLLQRYTERFFELDMDYLAERFAGPYRSWLRFFSLQYRRDRRKIARRSRGEVMPGTIRQDVVIARDMVHEQKRIEAEQPARQAVLGRYEKGLATDFDAAERATRVAAEAVDLAHSLECESLPARLID